jgi:hypothetical protein
VLGREAMDGGVCRHVAPFTFESRVLGKGYARGSG